MDPENTVDGVKGETVCRPATGTDVVQFFLVNYGLHALSVLTEPGGGPLFSIVVGLSGVLLPFSGIVAALDAIRICAIAQPNDLQVAAKSGALCMVVKKGRVIGEDISPDLVNIHGQHPPVSFTPPHIKDDENGEPIDHYCLVRLPDNFTVYPLKKEIQDTGPCELKLSYNYSFLKSIAAIAQVIYGCFELYRAKGLQLRKFGYAAYSLTVIPYIIMSLINLVAAICRPQYPSMFIVLCRDTQENTEAKAASVAEEPENEVSTVLVTESGAEARLVDGSRQQDLASVDLGDCPELLPDATDSWHKKVEAQISGAVGEAYESKSIERKKRSSYYRMLPWLVTILGVCSVIAPYLIIWRLTKFQAHESSKTQRAWLMAWLVISQLVGLFHGYYRISTRVDSDPDMLTKFSQQDDVAGLILIICCGLVPAIGGFVVVTKMILESQVCTVI